MTLQPTADNFLPTQPSAPQSWEETALPPLTLRESGRVATPCLAKAPGSPFWIDFGQNLTKQLLLVVALTVLSIGSYYLVSRYVATLVVVQGRSMTPTLQDGDRFILNRWSYFRHAPERGDLVVVKDPGHADYAVKRIIALPGESLFFTHGKVIVNGKPLAEPYLAAGMKTYLPDC